MRSIGGLLCCMDCLELTGATAGPRSNGGDRPHSHPDLLQDRPVGTGPTVTRSYCRIGTWGPAPQSPGATAGSARGDRPHSHPELLPDRPVGTGPTVTHLAVALAAPVPVPNAAGTQRCRKTMPPPFIHPALPARHSLVCGLSCTSSGAKCSRHPALPQDHAQCDAAARADGHRERNAYDWKQHVDQRQPDLAACR
eukprot:184458-Chlamydomonas_euryale.AAC.4